MTRWPSSGPHIIHLGSSQNKSEFAKTQPQPVLKLPVIHLFRGLVDGLGRIYQPETRLRDPHHQAGACSHASGAVHLDFETGSLAGSKSTYLTRLSGYPASGIHSSHPPASPILTRVCWTPGFVTWVLTELSLTSVLFTVCLVIAKPQG